MCSKLGFLKDCVCYNKMVLMVFLGEITCERKLFYLSKMVQVRACFGEVLSFMDNLQVLVMNNFHFSTCKNGCFPLVYCSRKHETFLKIISFYLIFLSIS